MPVKPAPNGVHGQHTCTAQTATTPLEALQPSPLLARGTHSNSPFSNNSSPHLHAPLDRVQQDLHRVGEVIDALLVRQEKAVRKRQDVGRYRRRQDSQLQVAGVQQLQHRACGATQAKGPNGGGMSIVEEWLF